ncbi:MAG: right-handed parallel beta-helix repeat-containing protein, partial [Lacibacter sp.]|nr:right-handed parallel beta-helix repeat-containing protein [Lacibacter sp.]
FVTISAAYQKAQTGDSLFVDAGTYTPGDGTVGKSISIIGTNYLLSPNDAANPLLINSTRNAETIIENLTWTIGANEINLEGLTFNPNNKQALIMNNTNFGNIKLSKNRFRINSNLTQISIVGNGITATTPAGIVNGGLTIADNRFEKTDAATGLSVNIGRFRNIGITNNTFVVAGTTLRTQQALNFGSGGVVDGLYCANNTFDYASSAFVGSRIANAFITANTINNTTNAFVATNSIPESSAIIFSNNVLNGSAGILPFIQYNRTTGNGTGAVSSLTIENNTITGNAIPVTTTILGSMNIIFQNSVLSPSVIVRGNVINYGGDLSSVPSHFIRPITLRGNLANALVEKNEITLTGINQQQGNSAINLPYCPAITLYTDNSTTSYIQPGSVINVLNNKVHGFKHSFAVYDPTTGFDTYVGFGNIPAGVTVNVNNNSFTGDSISINNGSIAAVTAINATCNWYGSALEADVKQKISIADVQHIPWLTNGTDNDVAVGFQPVANSCNGYQNKLYVNDVWTATDVFTTADGSNTNPGTAAAPFATIDYAVSLAKAGDTIYVDAGTYVTPNFTINKAITILGSNYSSSPNNPADRLAMNPVRNDHSLITGSTFTIASNDVRLEGLVFSPGAKSQVVMTTAGAANFTFKRNYSIVTSSNFLNLNGPAIPIGQASTFGNYLVDDNRFESRVTNASTCIMVGALNDVTLNNNTFFTPATSVQRVLTNCSSGSTGLAVNLVYSNNISNASRNEFFTAGNIASARVENNISLNGLRSIIVQPAIAASTDIQIRNNYIETSFAEFSPIQYQRSGTAAAGTVGNVLIENNTIIQNATGRPSIPAGILVQSAYINGNSSTSISRNIINFIGDYSLFAASGVLGVSFFGNWKNITLAENEITFNGTNLTSTVPPSGLSSSGIHVSSDNGAYFIPSNAVVNVTGNKITGFRNSFAVYDVSNAAPNTYVGYGNLQPGVTMNINNNSFTGDEFSINNGNIGQSVNATCNWYGSAVEDDVKLKISTATVQHIPWLTNGTDNDAAVGFQPVPNTCNGYPRTLYVNNDDPALTGDVFTTAVGNNGNPGTAAAPVATLTEAINRAKTGDTIYVDAGTYIENVIINKSVVIRGAKFGQNPQSSLNRGDESIFYPAFNAAGLNGNAIIFKTTANDITIDGFTIDGDNPATTGGQLVNGVDCNAGVAVFNDNVFISNLIVINNIVKNTSAYGIGQFKALGNQTAPAVTGALFRNNRVNNIGSRGIVLGYNAYGAIENNYITNVNNSGIWIAQHTLANPSGLPVRISGNIVSANILGIQLSAVSGSAPRVEVFNNEVTMPATGYGLSVISNSSGASFTNNKVVGGAASVLTNTSLAITPISFNNNSFTDYAAKIIETSTGTAQINAGCNWYGSAAVQDFYTKFNTNYVSFITWLTNGTDNDAATGFQPVPGSCDGYPTLITLNTSTNVTCNGAANGTITINTSYGKAPFTYTWTKEGDANFVSHDEDPTGLAPGIYHLAIVDGNGSNIYITDPEADGPGTIVVTITEPDELSATASGDNNVCFNGTIGSASVTAEGGTAPYTYLWSNGATSNAITNLAAGTYNVTITDANGCTTSASYEVTQPTLVTASITNGSSACANIATVNAAGGTPAYTYLWSNGSTA